MNAITNVYMSALLADAAYVAQRIAVGVITDRIVLQTNFIKSLAQPQADYLLENF